MNISANGFPAFVSVSVLLQHLLTHSPHLVKVERALSGSKYLPGSLCRFTLLIPYCLDYLRWDFVYNAEFPLAAPDVIVGSDDEKFLPLIVSGDGENLMPDKSCFPDWNYRDHTRLLSLVEELRDKYVEYQRICVAQVDDDQLRFEISTIVSREGTEMHTSSGLGKHSQRRSSLQCP